MDSEITRPMYLVLNDIGLLIGLLISPPLLRLLFRSLQPWIDRRSDARDAAALAAAVSEGPPPGRHEVKLAFFRSDWSSGGRQCAVCLEKYKEGEICAAVVKCRHKFHSACVLPWLVKHHTCPLCRTVV